MALGSLSICHARIIHKAKTCLDMMPFECNMSRSKQNGEPFVLVHGLMNEENSQDV